MVKFMPIVYEHCATVIDKTPSEVAQSEELLVRGQLKAYEVYEHDAISVGVDVYNVEFEALGGEILYYSGEELPSIKGTLIKNLEDLKSLKVPNPQKDGRMPILLNACKRIRREVDVPVNGTIVGPFTLAAILRGFEKFIVDILEEPEFARQQLEFSKEVGIAFAKAYYECGVDLTINESWISPPLCSPNIYKKFAQPIETSMIKELKKVGFKNIALISGGDTTSIIQEMLQTGTTFVLADWKCDIEKYKLLCRAKDISLRVSIPSGVVQEGNICKMRGYVTRVMDLCKDYDKCIFGCGILSYDTSPCNVIALKKLLKEKCND